MYEGVVQAACDWDDTTSIEGTNMSTIGVTILVGALFRSMSKEICSGFPN